MNAIIELGQPAIRMAVRQIAEVRHGHAIDFRLSTFSSRSFAPSLASFQISATTLATTDRR